jgi:hypothetical protein
MAPNGSATCSSRVPAIVSTTGGLTPVATSRTRPVARLRRATRYASGAVGGTKLIM